MQIDSTETPTLRPIGKANAATGAATAALLFASGIFGRLADSRPKNRVTPPREPRVPRLPTCRVRNLRPTLRRAPEERRNTPRRAGVTPPRRLPPGPSAAAIGKS